MQMVGLYKDPKGERIFTKGTVTSNLPTQTMDELKKRVTELEAIVVKSGVSDVCASSSRIMVVLNTSLSAIHFTFS